MSTQNLHIFTLLFSELGINSNTRLMQWVIFPGGLKVNPEKRMKTMNSIFIC